MKRFKLDRHKIGLTQRQLAEKIGVDVSTIITWENGLKQMRPNSFKVLLDLGFSEKSLLNPTEEI